MKNIVRQHHSLFENLRKTDDHGIEYWSARDLSKALEYSDYRNFLTVIGKAKEACINSQQNIADHFVDINDMIEIGKGAHRQ